MSRIESQTIVDGATPEALAANLAAAASVNRLRASAPVPSSLILSRRYLTGGVKFISIGIIILGIALGSLGGGPAVWAIIGVGVVLLLFVRSTETVSLVITAVPSGARVVATGEATGPLKEFVDGLLEHDQLQMQAPAAEQIAGR